MIKSLCETCSHKDVCWRKPTKNSEGVVGITIECKYYKENDKNGR